MKKITIAIDGYSSCGKSTIAKDLAKVLDYIYLDTGAMYRAVTLYLLDNGIIKSNGEKVYEVKEFLNEIDLTFKFNDRLKKGEVCLNGKCVEDEIRTMRVSNCVSMVSAIKEVRVKLVTLQKRIAKDRGVVMDGRDIGTVVCPDAELKVFMTADPKVRAKRRWEELRSKGQEISIEKVEKNLEDRDYMDTHREESPLLRAEDAIIIDNSELDKEKQLHYIHHLAQQKIFELNNPELLEN